MLAAFLAKDVDDQIGKAVDHRRHLTKAGRAIHHAEGAYPIGNAVKITKFALQAGQHRQSGEAGGGVGLFFRHIAADTAERRGETAVRVGRSMSGNQRTLADHTNPTEWQHDAGRDFRWARQNEAEIFQSLFDFHGETNFIDGT